MKTNNFQQVFRITISFINKYPNSNIHIKP